MKKIFAFIPAVLLAASCNNGGKNAETSSAYQISYEVSFDTKGKYLDVDMTYIPSSTAAKEVTFKMPVWAPGYYIIVDYPKYLMDFEAKDPSGRELKWEKEGKNGWTVETADTVLVSYKVLADSRSVAESRLEENTAFIAPNGVFMFVKDDVKHPVSVKFNTPAEWTKISTALEEKDGVYHAPDFDVLYDSPVLLGNQYVKIIEHEGHSYEFAVETPKGFEESPIADDFLKAVDQAIAIFGGTAYDSYHLLLLGPGGGGLEHQASQADYTAGHWDFDTRSEYLSMLKFLTHEYFHNYNVKAIRPAELVPFDYDKENYTTGLWISEGVTCFYESVLLMRAGIISEQDHFDYISGHISDTQNTPGRQHMSLRRSSYDIWLNFFNRNSNAHDAIISYYVKGPVVAFLLDTRIRTVTDNAKSLDNVMRILYDECYRQGKGFTEEGFWSIVERVAGQKLDDIRRYVDTTDEIDYESILGPAGLSIDRSTWKITRN